MTREKYEGILKLNLYLEKKIDTDTNLFAPVSPTCSQYMVGVLL